MVLVSPIACGGDAASARRVLHGAKDRRCDRVGRERADRRDVGVAAPAAGREREHGVAVGDRVDGMQTRMG